MSVDKSKQSRKTEESPRFFLKSKDFQRTGYWEFCDNCGTQLITRKCELICPKCGFFHSCSEP